MRTGKCKKCGDTYIGDDYGPLKECSCNKIKEETDAMIPILAERKRVIEQVRKFIKEELYCALCPNLEAVQLYLDKLERGEE